MKRKPKPKLPWLFDRPKYRQRNIIERMFGWLKESRRIGARYDKLARSFGDGHTGLHPALSTAVNHSIALLTLSFMDSVCNSNKRYKCDREDVECCNFRCNGQA